MKVIPRRKLPIGPKVYKLSNLSTTDRKKIRLKKKEELLVLPGKTAEKKIERPQNSLSMLSPCNGRTQTVRPKK